MNQEKQIWQFIGHYLHKHKELCIEGIGRFATQVHEFNVDPVAKRIIPTFRKIYFQSGEFETSPLFIQFLAESLTSSQSAIVDKLMEFVSVFKGKIQESQKLEIENFGSFKYNVMGELNFESNQSIGFEDSTFGLKPIHFAANLLKTKRIIVDRDENAEEEELTQMRESALKELKVLLDNAKIAENQKPQKSSKIFPYVATVLTLILLINLGFFLFKGPVEQLKEQISQMNILGNSAQMLDTQKTETPVIAPVIETPKVLAPDPLVQPIAIDSIAAHLNQAFARAAFDFDSTLYTLSEPSSVAPINLDASQVIPNPIVETPAKSIVKEEPVSVEPTTENVSYGEPNMVNVDASENGIDKGFYVVAGAFKNQENATRLRDKLAKKGDTSAVVFKPSTYPYYLVAFQKSANLNQALTILEKKQVNNPSIWVYCAF